MLLKFKYIQTTLFLTLYLYNIVNMIKLCDVNKIIRSNLIPTKLFSSMINLFFLCKIFYIRLKIFYINIFKFFYSLFKDIFMNNLNFILI